MESVKFYRFIQIFGGRSDNNLFFAPDYLSINFKICPYFSEIVVVAVRAVGRGAIVTMISGWGGGAIARVWEGYSVGELFGTTIWNFLGC